jgi:hypothetical protein
MATFCDQSHTIVHNPHEGTYETYRWVRDGLLNGGIALMPMPVHAAEWISGSDAYASSWIMEIEQDLLKKDYWYVYANDPWGLQAGVLSTLNQAAKAQGAKDRGTSSCTTRSACSTGECANTTSPSQISHRLRRSSVNTYLSR